MITFAAESRVRAAAASPTRLRVLYDEGCALCIRCRHWLENQPTYVELEFLGTGSPEARELYGPHLPWLGYELIVVSERGEAWVGPAAFLMCLWATRAHRDWSYRLSTPALAPLARRFFEGVSGRRYQLARFVSPPPACVDGACHHPPTWSSRAATWQRR